MDDPDMSTRLLDSAERRMRRGGYNSVSFRDLAADTKIKSASVHYHFSRKEDLGLALVERYSVDFFEALDDATRDSQSPRKRLVAFNQIYRNAITEGGAVCLCGLLGAEAAGLPVALNRKVQSFFDANLRWVGASLPDLLSDEERSARADAIVSVHQGAIILACSLDDVALFDSATSFVLKYGLATKSITKK